MTLITHIWTNNINVVAGDGRILDKTLSEPVVTDEMRKIYPNDNSFIAFHGSCIFDSNTNVPTVLQGFYQSNKPQSCNQMSLDLLRLFDGQHLEFNTCLIVGGQYNSVEANYLKDQQIIDDKALNTIGLRFNFDSEEQKNRIIELLYNAINAKTGNSLQDWDSYDNYTENEYLEIFDLFYSSVFADPIANPESGIGNKFDLGIIKGGQFKWIKTETKILTVTNK